MQKILLGIIGLVVVVGIIAYLMKGETEVTVDTTPTNNTQNTAPKPKEVKVNTLMLAENTVGNTAKITRATLAQPAYIVIYRTNAEGEVAVVGNSKLLSVGTYTNLLIPLDSEVRLKDVIVAVLHKDDDGKGTFDFPGGDLPIIENNAHITSVDVIGVPQATEDAALVASVEAFLKAEADKVTKDETPVAKDILEVTIHAANYKFTPTTIKTKEGQTVRVTFVSDSGLHDFSLDEFKEAKTAQLQGGKTETIEFVANKKGSFTYYCSVGQHRAMGMEGTLTVE